MEPTRREFYKQCAFQDFCKKVVYREACNAHDELNRHKTQVSTFSDLSISEEQQLCTYDKYFENESNAEPGFRIGEKRITEKLLAEALRILPKEKRNAVLLYYFAGKSDVEIAKMFNVPRSTVQYRRTSSFSKLKKYLEENADDWNGF